jgi:hypothetical protein
VKTKAFLLVRTDAVARGENPIPGAVTEMIVTACCEREARLTAAKDHGDAWLDDGIVYCSRVGGKHGMSQVIMKKENTR